MHATADHELLRRDAEHGAEDAFTELVQRHLDLVWAAARRVSGNSELARDVAQTVFADLARKAGTQPGETVLAGWLYRAACLAAAKRVREETRRALREQHAMATQETAPSNAAETRAAEELQPGLDAALAELSDADRDAVVLRFLSGRSLAEVGAALGTGEDAAQKRVSRALEKLREAFRRRGVNVVGGVMAAALGLAGAEAAPRSSRPLPSNSTTSPGSPKRTRPCAGNLLRIRRHHLLPSPPTRRRPKRWPGCGNSKTSCSDCAAKWPNYVGPRSRLEPGLWPRREPRPWTLMTWRLGRSSRRLPPPKQFPL